MAVGHVSHYDYTRVAPLAVIMFPFSLSLLLSLCKLASSRTCNVSWYWEARGVCEGDVCVQVAQLPTEGDSV